MKRFVLALDLHDDPATIAAYKRHHRAVWPEVRRSLRRIGIAAMDIYLLGCRLVMVMDVPEGFDRRRSFARHLASHPRCAEWEALMKTFQRRVPGARRGEWWAQMEQVFRLGSSGSRASGRSASGRRRSNPARRQPRPKPRPARARAAVSRGRRAIPKS